MAATKTVNGLGHDYLFDEGGSPHLRSGFIQSQAFREGVEQIVAHQIKTGNADGASSYNANQHVGPVAPISDIRGAEALNYRKGEKVLRCKLAACNRLASIYRWDDGPYCSITARLARESDQFLVNPFGILCDEVTAAHLMKVDVVGNVVDNGCTNLGYCPESVALHGALYAARPDVNCAFFISSPLAVSLSVLKCGLLPLCHEAMVVGEISYADYVGSLAYPENCQQLMQSFKKNSKVLFLRNFGVVVSGETIEETFHIANNLMIAVETQISLIPVGLNNIHFPTNETLQVTNNTERELPPGVNAANKWCYGEVEFEALMRQLDNAGYCTGYIYRDSASRQKTLRSQSTTDVPTTSVSSFSEDRDLSNLSHLLAQRKTARPEWTISPNTYHKDEVSGRDTPLDRKTPAKWVSDSNSSGLSKPRSSSVRAVSSNKFAPQGSNPRELREKVKEIRKEYFEDLITAGPQSTILEGLTWEEARRIKAGQAVGGVDNVLVSAASRGIIQRDHQPKALFYKNYQLGNPFENVTDRELDQYKREVEKKSRKGFDASVSDSEWLDRRYDPKDSIVIDQGRKSVDSELYLRESRPTYPAPIIRVPVLETNVDDLSPPVQVAVAVKPVLTPQSQPKAPEPVVHREPVVHKEPEQLKAPVRPEVSEQELQRTQSARYPERAPEPKKREEVPEVRVTSSFEEVIGLIT
jgi:adducin